jgi:hypothetical protein
MFKSYRINNRRPLKGRRDTARPRVLHRSSLGSGASPCCYAGDTGDAVPPHARPIDGPWSRIAAVTGRESGGLGVRKSMLPVRSASNGRCDIPCALQFPLSTTIVNLQGPSPEQRSVHSAAKGLRLALLGILKVGRCGFGAVVSHSGIMERSRRV